MDKNVTDQIESLRTFAVANNEAQFAHLCTAALAGEEWAVERARDAQYRALLKLSQHTTHMTESEWHANLTHVIRATDTARPDGAIPRKFPGT